MIRTPEAPLFPEPHSFLTARRKVFVLGYTFFDQNYTLAQQSRSFLSTGQRRVHGMALLRPPLAAIVQRSCGVHISLMHLIRASNVQGRYLTKLCDQVVALIAPDHAQSIVWKPHDGDDDDDAPDRDISSTRIINCIVDRTTDQEESIQVRKGFKVRASLSSGPTLSVISGTRRLPSISFSQTPHWRTYLSKSR